jgi:hypothetical protein
MAGGYGRDIATTVAVHLRTLQEAHRRPGRPGRRRRAHGQWKNARHERARPHALPRAHFPALRDHHTRWMDNDVYGHVNNVVHYSFFDTAVNRYLIEAGALDIHHGAVIGLVVQTQCHYFESLAFPADRCLPAARGAPGPLSSVRYESACLPATRR